MEKICLWLNFPSIHQTPLIRALAARDDVDLQVRYFESARAFEERRSQGWIAPGLEPYEQFVDKGNAREGVRDFAARVHILPGIKNPTCRALLGTFEEEGVEWCHWGERTGVSFASMVRGHPGVLRWVLPTLSRAHRWRYARRINASSLGVFAIGKLAEDDFVSWGVRRDHIRHLYYSTEDVRPRVSEVEGKSAHGTWPVHFIFIGSVCQLKGIDTLLRAFSAAGGDKWRLLVVGKESPGGTYRKLSAQLGIEPLVQWVGPVSSTEVGQWLDLADVVILPSLFDGWGAVLNEGASAGKALIATSQCGAAWHLIAPAVNGFRVAPANVIELSAAISEYLRHPGLAEVHGRASRDLYQREFTADRNAERLVSSIRDWRARRKDGRSSAP